jgi:hypothetical protein
VRARAQRRPRPRRCNPCFLRRSRRALPRAGGAARAGLDWKMWCGPGPLVAYNSMLSPRGIHDTFPKWRNTWEFGGGMITDWGAHHIDIAQVGAEHGRQWPRRSPRPRRTGKRPSAARSSSTPTAPCLTHVRGQGRVLLWHRGRVPCEPRQVRAHHGGQTVHKFWDREVDKTTSMEARRSR